ncbi:hypothetical protein OPIT5_09255 [Opitutaceae bacterium TAV5]|nr:hypothetical protein OPIT5_09255 [Opitutaceae bacterium TAV5]
MSTDRVTQFSPDNTEFLSFFQTTDFTDSHGCKPMCAASFYP